MNRFNRKFNNKRNIFGGRRAFTLIELIIAIGIFMIIIAGSAGAFASAFKSYKGAKNINENLKNAQYAMNLMAKTFRTSSLKDDSQPGRVIVYDYSQSLCILYNFTPTRKLVKAEASVAENSCSGGTSFPTPVDMTSGVVQGKFKTVSSKGDDNGPTSTRVGLITVVMEIINSSGGNSSSARLQSTSSLRDYTVSNVGIDLGNNPS